MIASTEYETSYWQKGLHHIAGIDEVGRGAWAGPMVIAAVIFPPDFSTTQPIYDSKAVVKNQRQALSDYIKSQAVSYSIIEVSVEVINAQGLAVATHQGLTQVIQQLSIKPQHLLVDAFTVKSWPIEQQTPIIKGDQKSLSIAAASIIAKVYRDNLMQDLDNQYPAYGFNAHVGYGTAQHRQAIKNHGLSPLHRSSYNLSKWL